MSIELAEGAVAKCDRCGGAEQVEIASFCPDCGPVPLCWRCWTLHVNEVADLDAAKAAPSISLDEFREKFGV